MSVTVQADQNPIALTGSVANFFAPFSSVSFTLPEPPDGYAYLCSGLDFSGSISDNNGYGGGGDGWQVLSLLFSYLYPDHSIASSFSFPSAGFASLFNGPFSYHADIPEGFGYWQCTRAPLEIDVERDHVTAGPPPGFTVTVSISAQFELVALLEGQDPCVGPFQPPSGPPPKSGKAGRGLGGASVINHLRGYYLALANASGLNLSRFPHMSAPVEATLAIDGNSDCAAPRLARHPFEGYLSIIYRRGEGTQDSPANIWRAVSYDRGVTWRYDPPDASTPFRSNVIHAREVFAERSGERLFFYNDNSNGDGTGLLLVDIYDRTGTLVGTFPDGGIGGLTMDDTSFDAHWVQRDTFGCVDVVFVSNGDRKRFRSVDKGRTWADQEPSS